MDYYGFIRLFDVYTKLVEKLVDFCFVGNIVGGAVLLRMYAEVNSKLPPENRMSPLWLRRMLKRWGVFTLSFFLKAVFAALGSFWVYYRT